MKKDKVTWSAWMRQYRLTHGKEIRITERRVNQKRKLEVLTYYSTYSTPSCNYCGINDVDVLCLDHINNDGYRHRREHGVGGGVRLYKWIRKNNFPEGFQVLCFNCNMKKRMKILATYWKEIEEEET